jgi:exonuclease III
MKILSANCQGLGNRPTVRSLLQVQKQSNPDVMFLSETHLDTYPTECLRKRLKMDFKIVNPSSSRSRGVMLL